jgi:hypothetical protein
MTRAGVPGYEGSEAQAFAWRVADSAKADLRANQ